MATFEHEDEDLLRELNHLRLLLEEKEGIIEQAGHAGQALLEKNAELERLNEEILADFSGRVEALQQENFSLRNELSASRVREKEAQSLDEERIREELEVQHQHKMESLRVSLQRGIDSAQQQLSTCEKDLQKKTLLAQQLQEKAARQDSEVRELRELLSCRSAADGHLESTLEELQCVLDTERCQRAAATTELCEARDEIERLQLDVTNVSKNAQLLSERLDEQETQASQWYKAMEESRDEAAVWRNQYDILKIASESGPHARTGNSLFGELEDERQRYEHEAVTLRLKLKAIDKQCNMYKHQSRQLKAQVVALLQSNRSQADQKELQRLKDNHAEIRQENQMLRAQLRHATEVQTTAESAYYMEQLQRALPAVATGPKSPQSSRVVVDFLQQQVELGRRREADVRNELETCRMLLLDKSNKLQQNENQLHQRDLELQQSRADCVRVRMQLDDQRQQLSKRQTSATSDKAIQTQCGPGLHITQVRNPVCSPGHNRHCLPCTCDELYTKPVNGSDSSPLSSPTLKSAANHKRAPLAALSPNRPRVPSNPVGKKTKCTGPLSPVKQPQTSSQLPILSRKAKTRTVYVHDTSAPNECAQQ